MQIVTKYEYLRQHFFGNNQVMYVSSAEAILFAHEAFTAHH